MERVVVVSDLHMGPAGPLNNFRSAGELCALLRTLDAGTTTFVLAGDVFDTLQVPGRPRVLDLEGAPGLLRGLCDELALGAEAEVFAELGRFVAAGGRLVVLPGNHDPELHHPAARGVLTAALGLADDAPGLTLHLEAAPWSCRVGGWGVLVGHGHLGDPWNRVDPAAVRRALARGERSLPLPPGSLLVLETINAFKRACDPTTGQPRFPFVDLLKPEGPWVPVLLLALDPQLALAHLPGAGKGAGAALLRALRQRLIGGRKLAHGAAETDGEDAEPAAVELLADSLAAALNGSERAAPRAVLQAVESALDGRPAARPGTLALGGGGSRFLLRLVHRQWHDGGAFFDPGRLGLLDRGIVAERLPEGAGPRVVVAGHTHAAREVRLAEDRVYLNAGTWSDLMRVPDEASDLDAWSAALAAGEPPRTRRLTYAELTAGGPRLLTWGEELSAAEGAS